MENEVKDNILAAINAKNLSFIGDFSSFDEALKYSDGYEASNIFEKTLSSTLKVKNGEAVFERDSFIFDKIQYSFPLLACLLKIGIKEQKLNILDFGGALGSHYFQNREFLKPLKIEKWSVVEQPHYVKAGRELIADEILNFEYSIDDVSNPNVIIASSVIQYMENPYEWLKKLINKQADYIIFDRTAFSLENRNRLTIEIVPPEIYETIYPAWFLDEKEFLEYFKGKYELILDFEDTIDVVKEIPSIFKGYFFKRTF